MGNFYPFLESERVYLREVRVTDVNENYYKWMNNPKITDFLESRFSPNSLEKLREYVNSKLGDPNNIFLAIILKENNRHIGNIKLGPINWNHRFGDIGIIVGEDDCHGKGYASEAIKLLTKHAFNTLNLHKVTAGAYGNNIGSIKAFQKAGFEIEGKRKDYFFSNGQYVDMIIMGLLNNSN